LRSDAGAVTFKGRTNGDVDASVTRVSTQKAMGSSAGSFSVSLKPSDHMGSTLPDLMDTLVDDDWLDITFFRHGRPFHTMRGLIEDIVLIEGAAGRGPTTREYTLTGRDFGCIFEKTKVWFNRVVNEIAEFVAIKIFEGRNAIGNPGELVEKVLYGFMGALEDVGRANWILPKSMPGAQETFAQTVLFANLFNNVPARQGVSLQLMQPNGEGIWQLAQEYSDPMFTELFCDLITDVDGLSAGMQSGSAPDETSMAIIYRDKPFINLTDGGSSPWFGLPLVEIPRTHVGKKRVSRSTKDRYNAFYVAPQVYQESGFTKDLMGPLWDETSIRTHGLRSFNIETRYTADESNLFNLIEAQRLLVVDWHCLAPYFLSGTLPLQRLYPEVRVGTRVRVVGSDEAKQEDYYVEGVSHNWGQRTGGKTSLSVTRGWRGGSRDLIRAITEVSSRYRLGTRPAVEGANLGFA
jgi:hypothetical protein